MLRILTLAACLGLPSAAFAYQEAYSGPHAVTLKAADGATVHGWHHPGSGPVVLLFHQAGGSSAEYDAIGWTLYSKGYTTLAIDARAGGKLFGRPNKTAAAFEGIGRDWMQALPDLEAALAWAKRQHPGKKVILWGSSYSAALAFLLAAAHPDQVEAVLAFSPGEYLRKTPGAVAKAAAKVKAPVFIMTPTKEKDRIAPITAALAQAKPTVHVLDTAVHGSSALIQTRCAHAKTHWPLVEAFLKRFPPLHLRKR